MQRWKPSEEHVCATQDHPPPPTKVNPKKSKVDMYHEQNNMYQAQATTAKNLGTAPAQSLLKKSLLATDLETKIFQSL
jgi:hypothetical protein